LKLIMVSVTVAVKVPVALAMAIPLVVLAVTTLSFTARLEGLAPPESTMKIPLVLASGTYSRMAAKPDRCGPCGFFAPRRVGSSPPPFA
jgi:hypothetical protein